MRNAGIFMTYTIVVWLLGFTLGAPVGMVLNERLNAWSRKLLRRIYIKFGWEDALKSHDELKACPDCGYYPGERLGVGAMKDKSEGEK